MRGLEAPPKEEAASRLLARMLVLIVLVVGVGLAIYSAVIGQRIDLTEDIRTAGLELASPAEVSGLTINLAYEPEGSTPVVFLHDSDVTGGLILAPLASGLEAPLRGVRLDLPGFGLSDRMPFEGPEQTAAGMAEIVASVLADQFDGPVVLVGVGFGGEVAAEVAVTYPETVSGLVMVDVDFWAPDLFVTRLARLPMVGQTATYVYETGGRFALDTWQPYCDDGGWCASSDELASRAFIVTIEDTTASLNAFRKTRDAAVASTHLGDITVPAAYVVSLDGPVSDDTVSRIAEEMPDLQVFESDTFQVHLQDQATVIAAIAAVAGA